MVKALLKNACATLSEVPELIGADSPACHRVKVALSNVNEALGILEQQEAAAPAPAPAPEQAAAAP